MSAISIQISELEMLQSMFGPGELRLDPALLDELKSTTDTDSIQPMSPFVSFTINLDVEIKMEVSVTLPSDYPAVEPEIFVRSESLDKHQQALINKELHDFVTHLERDEMCIYSAVSWLQENAHRFQQIRVDDRPIDGKEEVDRLVRLWIYSHHIYSKNKRRNILGFASQHCCTGFILPGRPGIICIEGVKEDCDEVWRKIRSMNWKKIMLKKEEDCLERSFSSFEEQSFNKCKDDRHMDMGEFFKFLEFHKCGYIFKEYFGVDGKISAEA